LISIIIDLKKFDSKVETLMPSLNLFSYFEGKYWFSKCVGRCYGAILDLCASQN
jgi:hypothetical protein